MSFTVPRSPLRTSPGNVLRTRNLKGCSFVACHQITVEYFLWKWQKMQCSLAEQYLIMVRLTHSLMGWRPGNFLTMWGTCWFLLENIVFYIIHQWYISLRDTEAQLRGPVLSPQVKYWVGQKEVLHWGFFFCNILGTNLNELFGQLSTIVSPLNRWANGASERLNELMSSI